MSNTISFTHFFTLTVPCHKLVNTHMPVLLWPVMDASQANFLHFSVVKSAEVTTVDYFEYFALLVQVWQKQRLVSL